MSDINTIKYGVFHIYDFVLLYQLTLFIITDNQLVVFYISLFIKTVVAMAKETVVRENPMMTVITLSRYVTSETSKKENLLRKLKFSDPPLYARYVSPKSALNKYLKDHERNILVFDDFIKKEKERVIDSDYKLSDQRCCLECLEILKSKSPIFFRCYNDHFSKKGLKKEFTHIYTHGIDVSLSPDLVIYDDESNKLKGFIKLNFSKDKRQRLTFQQGQLIAGLIKDHLEEQFEVKLDRKMCIAFDVYGEKIIYAPEDATWIKDKPKLDFAFEEIATLWPYIEKRSA